MIKNTYLKRIELKKFNELLDKYHNIDEKLNNGKFSDILKFVITKNYQKQIFPKLIHFVANNEVESTDNIESLTYINFINEKIYVIQTLIEQYQYIIDSPSMKKYCEDTLQEYNEFMYDLYMFWNNLSIQKQRIYDHKSEYTKFYSTRLKEPEYIRSVIRGKITSFSNKKYEIYQIEDIDNIIEFLKNIVFYS
nr:MAG TPA: hypothetical protein [Caudoviricetes sp.]